MYAVDMPVKLRFISCLEELLASKGWSYTDLYNKSGVSRTTIRSLTREGGLERIDRSSTEKLMNALNCSFDELWKVEATNK
ncbi:putative transcriptional regulator [Xenococcus sp. PCC 7305]|uniref:helix-turn-helix domain-containing protein n=1 Tax=Xenococcus sp. PCC 7305 TaxID=102125 RepID=UPI0002ACC745|nr:helix-turn-helix transcriptional regulator [Xenococcus sp. PCC 7305]ELS01120.1 putative transcriptional regulator [Xenococcus sp. PCC 7305]